MSIKLCVIMDPLESINIKKDTTFALLLEAQKRHWEIFYCQPQDILHHHDTVFGLMLSIKLENNTHHAFEIIDKVPQKMALTSFDIILMRKDPPVDTPYLYTTYLLELAQKSGCYIVNNPCGIRDANEKLYTLWFAQCCPPSLVTTNLYLLHEFLKEHQKIIVKALHSMGGDVVFVLHQNDLNVNVILENLTQKGKHPIMAQRYLPEIASGDKRIVMINGMPYPYAITRIPASDDFRGNLAKGAKGVGCTLTPRDRWICAQVGPLLVAKGLLFVGLDIIGDYLTEINVTSPTGVREIEAAFKVNMCSEILDTLMHNT